MRKVRCLLVSILALLAGFVALADPVEALSGKSTVLIDIVPLIEAFQPDYSVSLDQNGSAVSEILASAHDKAVAFLRGNEIAIWESYPAFVMANVTDLDRARLQSLGLATWPLENRTVIQTDAWRFDTQKGEPTIPEELRAAVDTELRIVQFVGPIKQSWIESLRSHDAVTIQYMPNFAFLIRVPATGLPAVSSLPYVQWVGPYHPAYKISPELSTSTEDHIEVVLVVLALSGALQDQLKQVGVQIAEMHPAGDQVILRGVANSESIKAASRIGSVLWVEPAHSAESLNNQAVWVIQSGILDSKPVHAAGILGQNQLITTMDSGLTVDHEMFSDPEGDPIGSFHRKVQAYYVPGGGAGGNSVDDEGHGTYTAGSIVGDAPYYQFTNPVYGTYNLYDGMSFASRLIVQDIQSRGWLGDLVWDPPDTATAAYQSALGAGSYIHSNSWGRWSLFCQVSGYTAYDATMDAFVFSNPTFLILHAAGNRGGLSGDEACGDQSLTYEASAKSLLTVGATGSGSGSTNIWDRSSRGGTADARLKPAVVAPGDSVVSAKNPAIPACGQLVEPYQFCSGTSASTAIVAGAAAMVRQYFTGGWYPTGQSVASNAFVPSAALLRATIINGAVEISGTGAYRTDQKYPNNDQGWGRINLDNALYFSGDQRQLRIVDEKAGLMTGQYTEYTFQTANNQPFEATLVWTDASAAAGCNPCLVNNLDLLVTDPLGNQYKGNVFAGMNPGQSTTGGQYDSINVEEGVLRLTPSAGTWRVRVTATNVPTGPQPFALVVTGALSDQVPLPVSTWVMNSVNPASVVDSAGRTHVVWQDQNNGVDRAQQTDYKSIQYARVSATGSLEIRKVFNIWPKHENPTIAINPTNNEVWVAYQEQVSYQWWSLRYVKSSDFGVTWQGPYTIVDPGTANQQYMFPSIAIDSGGRKHLVARFWQYISSTGQDAEHVAYFRTDAATPTGPSAWTGYAVTPDYTRTHTACTANAIVYDPNIVSGPPSTYLQIVYSTDPVPECGTGTGTTYVRHVRSGDRGVSWSSESTIGTTRDYARPNAVVADSGSNVYVAWHDWYTDFDIFFAKSTNSGSSWSAATRLAASGYQVYPSLAYANAVLGLSYADNSYGNYEIAIRKSTNQGASWGSPVRVTGDSGSSVNPSIRLDSAGANYLITWVDTRGNSNSWYDVYFQKVAA